MTKRNISKVNVKTAVRDCFNDDGEMIKALKELLPEQRQAIRNWVASFDSANGVNERNQDVRIKARRLLGFVERSNESTEDTMEFINLDKNKPLEIEGDDDFLLELPVDFDMNNASRLLDERVKQLLNSSSPSPKGQAYNVEIVVIVKEVLQMPIEDDQGATRVILDAIAKSKEMLGYVNPEEIIMFLKIRREFIKKSLKRS